MVNFKVRAVGTILAKMFHLYFVNYGAHLLSFHGCSAPGFLSIFLLSASFVGLFVVRL